MKNVDTIAVLDFGGQYAHLIANRVRRLGVFTEIHSPVPKLGICYGHQLIAQQLGGHVEPGKVKEYGIADLIVGDESCPILKGLPKASPMWMSHGDQVTKLPEGYKIVASTKDCEIAAVAFDSDRPERQIFGIQFHPEVTHSKFGMKLLENFIDFTGAKKTWNMKSYLPLITQRIKDQVKDRKVFLLVSGGVDSTVAFVLLNRVLGPEKVLGLHVDNGMMRLGESQKIMDFLTKEGMNNLKVRDASEHFLAKLKGVTAPETKRGIIGKEFLTVKDEEMAKLNLDPNQWMMAQGTIYPDTIESGGTKNADKIKTHHNRVQEVLDLMEKYKDEVRALGEELGIPHSLVWRHPFPGPGLGVRLLCSEGKLTDDMVKFEDVKDTAGQSLADYLKANNIAGRLLPRTYAQPFLITTPGLSWKDCEKFSTELANRFKAINRVIYQIGSVADEDPKLVEQFATRENFDTLRKFDNICTEFLQANDLYEKIWQMPVVLVPLRTANKPCIVMRPVNSTEAMTANFAEINQGMLAGLWRKFEAEGAGSLWYDVTHKPPGTIEWE